jgi:hypothetical protein
MPRAIGAVIGSITSEPTPDSQRIEIRLARTAVTIMATVFPGDMTLHNIEVMAADKSGKQKSR